MGILTREELVAMTTGVGNSAVMNSALLKLRKLQAQKSDPEYVRHRDNMIPQALQHAGRVVAENQARTGRNDRGLHDREYHKKMNELCSAYPGAENS